jgi:hypothetical protein
VRKVDGTTAERGGEGSAGRWAGGELCGATSRAGDSLAARRRTRSEVNSDGFWADRDWPPVLPSAVRLVGVQSAVGTPSAAGLGVAI